jgi:hypothetical protein
MSRSKRRSGRPLPRREAVAARLILIGGLLASASWFLDFGFLQPALDILAPLGWLTIVAGLVAAWRARREARSARDAPPL